MAQSETLSRVRKLSSDAIAKKQRQSEDAFPSLLKQIEEVAATGAIKCEFPENRVDQWSKKLLEAEGFDVYATTKQPSEKNYYLGRQDPVTIWVVSW